MVVRTYELLVSYIQPTSWVGVGASRIAYGANFMENLVVYLVNTVVMNLLETFAFLLSTVILLFSTIKEVFILVIF